MNNELKGVLEDNSFNVIVQITESGPRGPQGPPGIDGKSLEFHWDGTKLGVRVEGETEYIYVDLKGETGDIENLTMQHIINALGYTPANATNEHTHTNKSVIDKFTEVDNKLYYNGEEIGGTGLTFAIRTETTTPIKVEVVSSSVSETPDAGRIIFDTSQGKFFGGNGTEWV